MTTRLKDALWALLVALDILACTLWLAPLYVVGLADRPTGRELVSTYIGEAAENGMSWGITAASVIDCLALRLFGQADHCRRCYRRYRDTVQ